LPFNYPRTAQVTSANTAIPIATIAMAESDSKLRDSEIRTDKADGFSSFAMPLVDRKPK